MKKCMCGIVVAMVFASFAQADVIGLNFCDGWETPHLFGEVADGFDGWVDVDAPSGTIALGSVSATWYSSNTWSAGNENNSEQQLYRVYLDDGDAGDGASYAAGDSIGVSVTLSGLDAWAAAAGDNAYQIRFYRSTDTDGGWFQPIDIRAGAPSGDLNALEILETVILPPPTSGGGDFPTIGDPRAFHDSSDGLTAGTITITISSRNGDLRGTLAGLKITSTTTVPEPSALILFGIAGLALVGWKWKRA